MDLSVLAFHDQVDLENAAIAHQGVGAN